MRKRTFILVLLPVFLLVSLAAADKPDRELYWWQVDTVITVNGNYHLENENGRIHGVYSFAISQEAAIELDMSDDYILYSGKQFLIECKWEEAHVDGSGNMKEIDFSSEIRPLSMINYVLSEAGKIFFDLEIFLDKNALWERSGHLRSLILPRSALNKNMHPADKYNKGVFKGKNRVRVPEKFVRRSSEEGNVKAFSWEWRRETKGIRNMHTVSLELTVSKKNK